MTITTATSKVTIYERMRHADGEQVLLLAMYHGGKRTGYRVGVFSDDMESLITWEKGNGECHVVTADHRGRVQGCTCPDKKFSRRVWECCKHMSASQALIRAGKIEVGG